MIRQRDILPWALVAAIMLGCVAFLDFEGDRRHSQVVPVRDPDLPRERPVENDQRYQQFDPVRDPERRRETLGSDTNDNPADTTAFTGLPEPYTDVVSQYV